LDDPDDFVRLELEAALGESILVIPVLVQGAAMPRPEQLPPSLQRLAVCQAAVVRRDPDFRRDMDQLAANIDEYFERTAGASDVLGPETILISVGTWLRAEVRDRPVAEQLRDHINRLGKGVPHRRAIVVTDHAMTRYGELNAQPVIAIGGPGVNVVTKDIASRGKAWEFGRGMHGAYHDQKPPRVALWGGNADQTQESVRQYMGRAEGLRRFLEVCWK
jgi:hypothetical protein